MEFGLIYQRVVHVGKLTVAECNNNKSTAGILVMVTISQFKGQSGPTSGKLFWQIQTFSFSTKKYDGCTDGSTDEWMDDNFHIRIKKKQQQQLAQYFVQGYLELLLICNKLISSTKLDQFCLRGLEEDECARRS